MEDCAVRLEFGLFQNLSTGEKRRKLEKMQTCKYRFCEFCNWRKARKLGIQTYRVLENI